MTRPAPRPFRVADAMVLIAASACGFGLATWYREVLSDVNFAQGTVAERSWILNVYSAWALMSWSLSLTVLHLFPGRHPLRRLASRPGFLVGVAAGVAALCCVLQRMPDLIRDPTASRAATLLSMAPSPYLVAPCLVVAWVTQALGGRWRPEAHWLDRAGISLGLLWLTLAVLLGLFHRWL